VTRASFIYLITNRDTGACYVGKANDPSKRWKQHQKCARRAASGRLYYAMHKHGFDAFDFSVVEEHESEADAYEAEAWMIEYLRSIGAALYNLNGGGEGGSNPSPETRAKMSAAKKGRNHSPESRAKMSEASKGRKKSDEHRANVSAAQKGRKATPETRAKLSAARKGRKHSPETRAKIGAAQKGHKDGPLSDECRAKIAEALTGRKRGTCSPETRAKISATLKGQKREQV
jgi:group I intron endonuclease